jgi:hypothetical protein
MALVAGTLNRAGPLSSDILNLQVSEHGPEARGAPSWAKSTR